MQNEPSKSSENGRVDYAQGLRVTGQMPSGQGKSLSWHNETYDIDWLREKARRYNFEPFTYIMTWLKEIDVVPKWATWTKVFSAYPLLDKRAIKGEHLASLALEWDKEGPSDLTNWLDMVEFECAGNPTRDTVVKALEAVGERTS